MIFSARAPAPNASRVLTPIRELALIPLIEDSAKAPADDRSAAAAGSTRAWSSRPACR